jgi:hypothetical protein
MGMTKTTMRVIEKSLDYCGTCPGFYGAVLSTADGLVLASTGNLIGDEPAACAGSLNINTNASLNMLCTEPLTELLAWTSSKVWYLKIISGTHTLLVASTETSQPEQLRNTVTKVVEKLSIALRLL